MVPTRRTALLLAVALWLSPSGSFAQDATATTGEPPGGADAPAAETATGAASAAAAEPDEGAEISIYRELKTVEAQVDTLKEKVFRSKARLLLLEEKVIRGVVSGAKAVLRHVNSLGPAYRLDSITYYFDGNPIFQKTDVGTNGALSKTKKQEIFEANIPPGNHTLSVSGLIRGKGTGLFSYLSDYSFQFSSSYSFMAQDGKTTRLDSVLYKKGGALADYIEGPAVEFKFRGEKDKKGKGNDDAAGAGE